MDGIFSFYTGNFSIIYKWDTIPFLLQVWPKPSPWGGEFRSDVESPTGLLLFGIASTAESIRSMEVISRESTQAQMNLVLLKNLVVFMHLLCMALAVGKMLEYDFRFLRSIHRKLTLEDQRSLLSVQRTMTWTLYALWFSGLVLVYLGYSGSSSYLDNQKLWMKVAVVSILTLNGIAMHHFAFPLLRPDTVFLALPKRKIITLVLFGTCSSVSWLYASFLGIARSWNNTVAFGFTLNVYLTLLGLALSGATIVVLSWRRRGVGNASGLLGLG